MKALSTSSMRCLGSLFTVEARNTRVLIDRALSMLTPEEAGRRAEKLALQSTVGKRASSSGTLLAHARVSKACNTAMSPPLMFAEFVPNAKGNTFLTTRAASSVAGETSTITVKVGDKLPAVNIKELVAGAAGPVDVNLSEICAGKKVAIFGVPGAFTPGCSKSHLPSFMTAQEDLKSKGVDLTICVATNDAYVMKAWGSTSGGADAGIRFFSDANGDLTKALGLKIDTPTMLRTKRFSLIAEGNVVTHYFSSEKESSDTWAPAVLAAL